MKNTHLVLQVAAEAGAAWDRTSGVERPVRDHRRSILRQEHRATVSPHERVRERLFRRLGSFVLAACVSVVAVDARAEIMDFDPDQIQKYINDSKVRNSLDGFIAELPAHFKKNWIMMSQTESNQMPIHNSTAVRPRLILQSEDATQVFGVGTDVDGKGNYADPVVEYMQWDPTKNKFRFHVIDSVMKKVTKDVKSYGTCHKGRPNWDAYDSWAGVLPFNRDRLYAGSIEADAVKRIFTHLKDDPIMGRKGLLTLPPGVNRDAGGTVTLDFSTGPGKPGKTDAKGPMVPVKYPGTTAYTVAEGGAYLLFDHTKKDRNAADPEGRGVAMFDNLNTLNAIRVAQEILDHPKTPDVRYIALAIAKGCVTMANLKDYVSDPVRDKLLAWHDRAVNSKPKPIKTVDDLLKDTELRRRSLPKTKVDLQFTNLTADTGLIRSNGATFVIEGAAVKDIFRRTKGIRKFDEVTKAFVDREEYGGQDETITLFRLFLEPEPVRVAVQKWSMSVRGRSNTYTFGDVLSFTRPPFDGYTTQIKNRVEKALADAGEKVDCPDLAKKNLGLYTPAAIAALPGDDSGTSYVSTGSEGNPVSDGTDDFVSTGTGGYESWYPGFVDYIDRGADGDLSDLFYTGEPPPSPTLDLDGDGSVGSADADVVAGLLGTCTPDTLYNPVVDFDRDGCITELDLAAFDDLVSGVIGDDGDGTLEPTNVMNPDDQPGMNPDDQLGTCLGEPGYDPAADLDGDGCVTAADTDPIGILGVERREVDAPSPLD